jgi:hypothetical protein
VASGVCSPSRTAGNDRTFSSPLQY